MTPAAVLASAPARPLPRCHYLAQLAHESNGFRTLTENLNYSAAALVRTWPTRFDLDAAAAYARQPQKIANKVYGGRLGNGTEATGDGWRFRGRGYIQITGRANYADYSQKVFGDDRLVRDPDMAALPDVAAKIAAAYWKAKGLDAHAERDDLVAITKRINGGTIGLDRRRKWLAHFKAQEGIA
jgi:putative chitinase